MIGTNLLVLTVTTALSIGFSDGSDSHIRVHITEKLRSANLWEQCGGDGWSTNCNPPGYCFRENQWYAQCRPLTPPNQDVPPYQQCGGGISYPGSTKCTAGSVCTKIDSSYFQCIPSPPQVGAVEWWGKCGGIDYLGPKNCAAGSSCKEINDWYSQCIPSHVQKSFKSKHSIGKKEKGHMHVKGVGMWEQCGGKYYNGDTNCNEGLCYPDNEDYSQCRPLTHPGQIVPPYGQCGGGLNFPGSTDCGPDATCEKSNNSWSMCVPKPPTGPVEAGGKCGGKNYFGSTECVKGYYCKYWCPYYSQCVE